MGIKFVKPAAVQQTASTGVATASQTEKTKGVVTAEQHGQEPVKNDAAPETYTGPLANVRVLASQTKNLGDFNSIKIEVALDMPSPPDEIDETYQFAVDWVNAKIEDLFKDEG